jgi:ribosome biogenesis GTPase
LSINKHALVIASFGKDTLIEYNNTYINTTARKGNKCVVGDTVIFNGEVITEILPRRNLLQNNGKNIASNIDKIFLVLAIQPYPQLESIDNYLIKAQSNNLDIEIIINKCDIVEHNNIDMLANIYTDIGYCVHFISVQEGINTDILWQKTQNNTCVFVGQSGVGKSSIVNFLTHNVQHQATRNLGKDGLGMHTTTSSKVFFLEHGGRIIDTPGVREFNPKDFTREEVKQGFREIHRLSAQCKFSDCNHIAEPQCEVKKQLELGTISKYRYNNYKQLLESVVDLY